MSAHITLAHVTECTSVMRAINVIVHCVYWMMLQNVYLKFLLLNKAFLACRAFMWEAPFMLLHVIEHCVLIVLYDVAMRTDKLALLIPNVTTFSLLDWRLGLVLLDGSALNLDLHF
jgi:hypothetical protein